MESNGEAAITANLFFIIILNTFIRLEKKGKLQLKVNAISSAL